MPKKYASMRERLNANSMEFVECPGQALPCRLWTGAQNSQGRPKMGIRSRFRDPITGHRKTKTVSATRMSLADFIGLKLYQLNHVLHHCDRDNNRCIEPTHLYQGTQKKNMADMVERNRHWKGERFNPRPKGHKGKPLSKNKRAAADSARTDRAGVAQTST